MQNYRATQQPVRCSSSKREEGSAEGGWRYNGCGTPWQGDSGI